jgi:hypothetical protein
VKLSVCPSVRVSLQSSFEAERTFGIFSRVRDITLRLCWSFCSTPLLFCFGTSITISISSNFREKIFWKTGDEDSGLSLVQVWFSLGDFIVRQMKRVDGPHRKSVSRLRITIYESDSYSSFSVILSRGTAPFYEGFRILICTKFKIQI